MAMASRGPVFAHLALSPKWSKSPTRVDQYARAPFCALVLVLCALHNIRTTGGAQG